MHADYFTECMRNIDVIILEARSHTNVQSKWRGRGGSGHTETNFGASAKAELPLPLRRKPRPRFPRRRFFESGTSALAYSLWRKLLVSFDIFLAESLEKVVVSVLVFLTSVIVVNFGKF